MCGIAGIFHRDGRPVANDAVVRITRPLAHRGPDGEGIHIEANVGLGHRRLAILDLTTAGVQPMACVENRYWITYNGELFDFIEIRRELTQLGHARTSTTLDIYWAWVPA